MTTKGKGGHEEHKEPREAALKGKNGRPKAVPPGEGKTSEDTATREIRTNEQVDDDEGREGRTGI
jgi:hypothetical protein